MGWTFDPQKYEMAVCPVCQGKGKFKKPEGFDICKKCWGFGFVKMEPEGDMNDLPIRLEGKGGTYES
jgi:DnaJ-class molecular chaperone